MRREPDNLETMDDSGEFDVREMRGERVKVYVERPKKPDWLVVVATTILAGAVFAAWTANARLAALETKVTDLTEQVARLERALEPRYRGVPDAPNAR